MAADAVPSPMAEFGSGHIRVAKGPSESQVQVKPEVQRADAEEDAPSGQTPGIGTAALQTAAAVARAARPGGGSSSLSVVLIAILGGGGVSVGYNRLIGSDEVAKFEARLEEQEASGRARDAAIALLVSDTKAVAQRVDATETQIAEGELTRLAEVRYLIALSVQGFSILGVDKDDLPDLPPELDAKYHVTERDAVRRSLFAQPKPGTIPRP